MKYILVANWKNHPNSLDEASDILSQLSKKASLYQNTKVSTYIAPPVSYLELVSKKTKRFAKLAVQDISSKTQGVHTGEVTIDILKSFGVRLAILGHSERRALGETDEVVRDKVKTVLKAGITPLVCVGEGEHDPEGNYFEIIRQQIIGTLSGLKKADVEKLMIAYEPVWAIGTKSKGAISREELSQVVIFIKKVLTENFSRQTADKVAILYGGSVDGGNAKALLHKTGVRGFLVGRASLQAKSFSQIAEAIIK